MQSMEIPYLTSFGARRAEGGFGHRSAVAMWAVAVLLAVLAVVVPVNQPASAQTPPSVTVSLVEVAEPTDGNYKAACESIVAADAVVATEANYETGCILVILSNIDGFVDDAADPDWILSVSYKTASQTYARSMSGGPGKDWESDFPHELDAGGRLIIHLDRLVPESAYEVEALLYEEYQNDGQWMKKAEGSTTFRSKGGCYVHTDSNGFPDPDNDPAHDRKGPNDLRPKWFGGSFNFSTQEETELTLDVYVTNSGLAGVNSGRCIYYLYRARGGADRGPFSAYVYTESGGRRVWIRLIGLEMGTTYDFTVSFHPTLEEGNVGTQATTKGPRMAVRSVIVDRITLTSARATIAVDNEGDQSHTVYYQYFETADEDDINLQPTAGSQDTVTEPVIYDLSGLTAATEYKVEASLESGFPTNQSEFDIFPTKPNKPTGLTVTSDDEQLEVEWTKPAGGDAIDEYLVQWKSGIETFQDADTDGREVPVAHVSGTTTYDTTISSLANGTEYTVHVIAKNESGEAASEEKKGTPATIPDEPTSLEVTPGNEKFTLTWVAPIETGGASITGFVVEYKQNTALTWTTHTPIGPSTLTAIITGLTNDILYDVRVRADNGVVADPYSWAVKTGTPVPDPSIGEVSVPSNTITKTTATATVTIDDAKTGDEQAVHLRHRVNTSGTSWTTATPKNTDGPSINFDLTSLTGNTEYIVEAWLATDTSDVESTTFTTSPVEPDAPTDLNITPGDKKLKVTWSAPSDRGGSQLTNYKIQWKSGTQIYDPATREHTVDDQTLTDEITGLINGTEYTVQVIAVTSAGDGTPSSKKGTPRTIPDAPTSLIVSPGNEKLTLTWEAPNENGGINITGYVVEYKEDTAQSWIPSNEAVATSTIDGTTTYSTSIPDLTNDTPYDVRVRADNGVEPEAGKYYNWEEGSGTPVPNPSIGSVTVDPNSITQTEATVTVTIEDDNDEEQTVYLQYQTVSNGVWSMPALSQNTDTDSAVFRLDTLTGNTEYEVQAWLQTDVNNKVKSDEFTTAPVVPAAPSVSVTSGDKKLTLTWNEPDNGGDSITGYIVQWKSGSDTYDDDATNNRQASVTTLTPPITYEITGLLNGTTYDVRVRAVNTAEPEAGQDYNWGTGSDKPRTIPAAPTVSITPGNEKLDLSWNKPADGGDSITGFIVQYKKTADTTWNSLPQLSSSTLERTISSLDNGDAYSVRVRAVNSVVVTDEEDYDWGTGTGTPRPDPSVTSVTVAETSITQTTATATVTIDNQTDESQMVHLRYRVSSSSEAWTTPVPQSTTDIPKEFPLSSLKSDTEYRVEASLDSAFNSGVQFKLFTTKRPTVSSVVVDDSTISQAGATANVTIQEPNGKQQTVRLRYRPHTQDDWSTTATDAGEIPVNTSTDVAAVPISDLKSGTLYEVEASLESDYSQWATTTFTTEGPSLIGMTITEVMQQSAKATIGIEAPNGQSLAIFVRHRKVTNPVNEVWTRADTSSIDTTALAPLSDLTSGTEYEVQASLDNTFPAADTISKTFTTHDPSLSALTVMSVTLTGATLKVGILAPNGESQTINYRYRPVTQNDWTTTATDAGSDSTTTTTESAEFTLSGLSSGTQYEVQATLDSDLDNPTLSVLEATLTTLTPDPSISDVAIDAKQTTAKATITIANPGTSGNTVHLHFRVQNTNAWSSPALTSTTNTSEAIIDMTSLTESTTYEVEIALNSGFTNSTTVTFTTLVTPTITSVSVDDITKTTATATVAIANSDGTNRTVHLQYREKDATPADTWTKAMEDSDTGSQEFDLTSLKPGTTYEVKASFDGNFVTGVEDTEFTTTYAPSISSVSVGGITKTTATATVSIANPDGTSRTVHLQYREKDADPEDTWTKAMEDSDTSSQEFDLTSLTPGTTYEVQASFDSNFSPHKDTTFTTVFEPSISAVGVGDIEKTTATATVVIANPDGTDKTVNLQYREYNRTPEAEWTSTTPKDTATGSTTFDLSSLTPGTTYEVQASFDTNFDTLYVDFGLYNGPYRSGARCGRPTAPWSSETDL